MKLLVFTSFSGYDSQCMALDRVANNPDFEYDLVGWSEIDKYAIQAHNAVYPQWADRNYGDITKIDWNAVPDFDLFTYSSPCQDFSSAGKQAGGEQGSGTRSSLLWECQKAIEIKRPKYLLMENVAALVSKKFIKLFNRWQLTLEGYGYRNFAKVLNAKDYGVPQNRERIFMVSILGDEKYEFPKPFQLSRKLKDVLEKNVDDKYYLSEKTIQANIEHCERKQAEGCGFKFEPTTGEGYAKAINTMTGSRHTDNYIKEPIVLGWVRDEKGNVVKRTPVEVSNTVTSCKRDNTQNYVIEPINTDKDGNARTINSHYPCMNEESVKSSPRDGYGYVRTAVQDNYRIRKLTERECFRMMDVSEEDIDKIQAAGISRSQQYKMAGNSIVVSCLYHIFDKLFINKVITDLELF